MTRRKIHLPSGVWEYYVSRNYGIIIWSPDGHKYMADTPKLTGRTWEVLERGQRKRTADATVLPSEVRDYIKSELVGVI